MPDPVWPATVPDEPLQGSYGETFQSNLSKFQPDVGPPTVSRRSILKATRIECAFRMTEPELSDFLDFFHDELEDGSLAFEWTNPIYAEALRYRFDPASPPRWDIAGMAHGGLVYRVSVACFRIGVVAGSGEEEPPPPTAPWVVALGVWNDAGAWIDTDVWIDGAPGTGDPGGEDDWVVRYGVWDDTGIWIDENNWKDVP